MAPAVPHTRRPALVKRGYGGAGGAKGGGGVRLVELAGRVGGARPRGGMGAAGVVDHDAALAHGATLAIGTWGMRVGRGGRGWGLGRRAGVLGHDAALEHIAALAAGRAGLGEGRGQGFRVYRLGFTV